MRPKCQGPPISRSHQIVVAVRHIVILGHRGDLAAEGAAAGPEIRLSQHEIPHAAREQAGSDDSNGAAQAVAEEIESIEGKMTGKFQHRPGMVVDRVAEIRRVIAEARSQKVHQEHAAADQGRI